ncbi:MAG: hypothetical protein ABSE58_09115 [Candidatus Limnocylindrales bacterium]
MDDRVWKNVSIVLGVVCALLIGVAGALMILGHGTGSTPTAEPGATDVASASGSGNNAGPSGGTSHASPTPAVTPTPGVPSPATITFNSLGLDAANDAKGTARTFTFISDGAGSVTFAVTKISAGGTAKLCIKVDTGAFACQVGGAGKLPNFPKGKSDPGHNTWTATVVGYGNSKPTVDVTFTWPTASPKVTMSHGRFQGSSTSGVAESLNGFTATFKPRAPGAVNVQATWTLVTANATLTLMDATSAPSVTVDTRQYQGATYINPAFTANVDNTKTYMVELRNTSADSERPDLTAQITFP